MAYTTAQLVTAYTNANLGKGPDAATTLTLDAYATQSQAGGITDATALSSTLKLVNGTTAVAVETYQFFTGHAPSAAGLTYLVNSTTNTADLNDAYYSKFAQENRFINFSINLATGAGEGAAAFAASYGTGVTFAQTVATAYDKIIGNAAATAAGVDVAAAVAYLSRQANIDYLTAFVKANTGFTAAADIDLAVKAALIGEILSAATTSGIGGYSKSTTSLITDLSDGTLSTDNAAGINILTAYPSAPPSVTTALTANVDNFVGTGANDVLNGLVGTGTSADTFTVADNIDGGAGTDTLNLTAIGNYSTASTAGVKISNVENININGTGTVTADTTGFAGTTALTVNSVGAATLTAASTTAVALTSTQNATGNVSITGGSTVVATLNIADGQTGGTVGVSGTASSVSVVNNAVGAAGTGVGAAATIADTGVSATKAGTLTSVSLTGTGAGSTIASNALTTLALSGAGTVSLTNSLTTPTNTTLALNLAGTNGVLTDVNNEIKTLNVVGTATATIGGFADTGLTALNVSGTKVVTFTSAAGMTNLATVAVTGSAGIGIDVSGLTKVTSVDTTGTTGASKVTVDATKTTFAGGAGNDTVTVGAAPTKSLTGGAGTDTLVANIAGGYDNSANGKATGFEVLGLGGASTGTFNASGFTGLSIAGTIGGASTFSSVAAGTALTFTGTNAVAVTYNLADSSGTTDAATVNLSSAAAISVTNLTLTGVENVTVNTADTNTTAHIDTFTLLGNDAKSLTAAGNTGLTLTAASTALRTVDAHAITGDFSFSSGVTTGATAITGSATGANTIVGNAAADTIIGGAKADTITTGAGLDVVTTGGGADTVILGVNANGNTYATITDFTSKAISATAFDTIDASNLVAHGNVNNGTTGAFALTDKITLGATAAFADFLDAAAAGDGSTNTHGTWFTYGGDTYIVLDNNAAATFQNGSDQVIKLTGVQDLSTGVFTAGTDLFTLGN